MIRVDKGESFGSALSASSEFHSSCWRDLPKKLTFPGWDTIAVCLPLAVGDLALGVVTLPVTGPIALLNNDEEAENERTSQAGPEPPQ